MKAKKSKAAATAAPKSTRKTQATPAKPARPVRATVRKPARRHVTPEVKSAPRAPLGSRIAKDQTHATTMLLKLGVNKKYHKKFTHKLADGRYQVNVVEAAVAVETSNPEVAQQKPVTIPKRKPRAASCAGDCLALFLKGKTNQEVWDTVRVRWQLGDDRAHYVSWYRCHFRRIGKLPPRKD